MDELSERLNAVVEGLDLDGTGFIPATQFLKFMLKLGIPMTESEREASFATDPIPGRDTRFRPPLIISDGS